MKKKKKLLAVVIAAVMVMAMGIPAMAATYQITVDNAVNGQTYTAYKVFDVTYDASGHYSYTIDSSSGFYDTVNTFASGGSNGLTLAQIGTTTVYNVTVDTAFTAEKAADLATALNSDSSKPTSAGNATASGSTATIDLPLNEPGYYFVDSSLGSLCALNTTNPTAKIKEKNSYPTIEKLANGEKTTTASIGDTVPFLLKVNTGNNANAPGTATGIDNDYVITDTLPAGMTYTGATHDGSSQVNGTDDTATVTIAEWTLGTDFTVEYATDVMTITLKKDKLDDLARNSDIKITYKATLDADAVIGTTGNENTAQLKYGTYNAGSDSAKVYTYKFDLTKTGPENVGTYPVLTDAKFRLYDSPTGGNEIKLVSDGANKYRPAVNATEKAAAVEITAGEVEIIGLANGTYYLEEVSAPDGYNKLTARQAVTINDSDLTNTPSSSNQYTRGSDSGVHIINKTGSLLPSTGGMGTTVLYIVGIILVAGSAILFVTRRRMNAKK